MTEELKAMFGSKKVILLGIGISNMPLAYMLTNMGAKIEIRDKRTAAEIPEYESLCTLGAEFVLGEGYLSDMQADYIFRTPGLRPDVTGLNEARAKGIPVVSEMGMFLKCAPCRVIAVTGSDGKSTTTTLISKILEKEMGEENVFLGGNVGTPLLHRIGDMNSQSIVAAELSSFQLMDIDCNATVAVIKNITPNHLNWHTDMDEYIEAKARILKGTEKAVLNFDDSICRELSSRTSSPIIWFSRKPVSPSECDEAVYPADGYIVHRKGEKCERIVALSDILLPGEHNIENYSTAIAATLGIASKESVAYVAKNFKGVHHRLELVCEKGGVKFYNSSIDSSPTRTAAAISALNIPINIICGGYDKNIPFEPLADALIGCKYIKSVTLTGATMGKIYSCLTAHPDFESSGIVLNTERDFKDAVLKAAETAGEGECVLLSPACASFDAFKNFEARGEFFAKIVNEM